MLQTQEIKLSDIRARIRAHHIGDEATRLDDLIAYLDMPEELREKIVEDATEFVRLLRRQAKPGMMETFLTEYGLSTEEGVALMCLAEALLRVPDDGTIDALIHDKIAPANWSKHLGHSTSPLVNVSTWALMLTGKVISLEERETWDVVSNVRQLIKRTGEPVIRKAVAQAMKTLGHQFVLGRSIDEAITRAKDMENKGYQYSYDMLGEAAKTAKDASKYFLSYSKAISKLSEAAVHDKVRDNPGISIKLSALHPRYEFGQRDRVLVELVPRVTSLAMQAKNAGMGFNIDAEEADRLDLSLDVIEAVLSVPDLAGWEGFGVVVQAYGPRAFFVLDWCYSLAVQLDRKIMIRLVKGAYWDTEIKLAQVEGLEGYPVFTQKSATDVSYMACAKKLISMTDHIYPQFATHNAHTVVAVLEMADDKEAFEFQRLHGMGESLHDLAKEKYEGRCRIYAPVGVHEDLLAYLVRRLLENGANSSFVNQVFDEKVPARHVVRDPVGILLSSRAVEVTHLPMPHQIFPNGRINSSGINFSNPDVLARYQADAKAFASKTWRAGEGATSDNGIEVRNPADHSDVVGYFAEVEEDAVVEAYTTARQALENWRAISANARADILRHIADAYEVNSVELMTILTREAGKSPMDALNEIREAVDFCRYYADEAEQLRDNGEASRGVFVCISPWNFPLAIFTGQIVAALVAGNTVLAKPAPQTPLVAAFAVNLMHEVGIPAGALQLMIGGVKAGQALTELEGLDGVCFTGSTGTAQKINQVMAGKAAVGAPLIAETGGLNAMIVDSTALPEQAVRDIVTSAFQSAGQRCSALRILYVQEDIADKLIDMLCGAMDELIIGDPASFATDVGPVIDASAQENILSYVKKFRAEGKIVREKAVPAALQNKGYFVPPVLLKVSGIEAMDREVFGPVLHLATYKSGKVKEVVQSVNNAGFGLTLGLHTRVDHRVAEVAEQAHVGNLYVNRNQIGAVVGVQPFGGEGLSGTGPKAGGPLYLHKFRCGRSEADLGEGPEDLWLTAELESLLSSFEASVEDEIAQSRLLMTGYSADILFCAGPTGERNQLSVHPRGCIVIAGKNWMQDSILALATGNSVILDEGAKEMPAFSEAIKKIPNLNARVSYYNGDLEFFSAGHFDAVCLSFETTAELYKARTILAEREGKIVPVLSSLRSWREFIHERCLSIDTTASGGNAALLASAAE